MYSSVWWKSRRRTGHSGTASRSTRHSIYPSSCSWRARARWRRKSLSLADDPLAWEGIQALTAVLPHHQRLAELKAHLLVLCDDVRLDDDHHVLAEDDLSTLVPGSRARLKNRRILIGAMDQIVVDRVAAAVDDLRRLLGLSGGGSVFNDRGEGFKSLDRSIVEISPLWSWTFAEGVGAMDLPAVAPIGAADLRDQAVALLEPPVGLELCRDGEMRLAHRHAGHKMNSRVAAGLEIDRLQQCGQFVFTNPRL